MNYCHGLVHISLWNVKFKLFGIFVLCVLWAMKSLFAQQVKYLMHWSSYVLFFSLQLCLCLIINCPQVFLKQNDGMIEWLTSRFFKRLRLLQSEPNWGFKCDRLIWTSYWWSYWWSWWMRTIKYFNVTVFIFCWAFVN